MESVDFITTESGKDLIVAFAISAPDSFAGIKSLLLLRTPKYEVFLEEWERGVRVTFERNRVADPAILKAVEYSETHQTVRLRTTTARYHLDVRKLQAKDLKRMCEVLRLMNYDQSFEASGI